MVWAMPELARNAMATLSWLALSAPAIVIVSNLILFEDGRMRFGVIYDEP